MYCKFYPRCYVYFLILDVCKITFISILLLSGVIKYIRNSVFLVSSMFKTNNTAIVTAAVEEIDIFDEIVPPDDGTSVDKLLLCKFAVSYIEKNMLSVQEAAHKAGIPRSLLRRYVLYILLFETQKVL